MTNRIFEQEVSKVFAEYMGYKPCSVCKQGLIAQDICVMCK